MNVLVGLVRHAAHDDLGEWLSGRTRDVPLSQSGRAQAARLAAALRGREIAAIHASPRRRTVETAGILGEATGRTPVVAAELDEIDFGGWSGRRFADLDGDPAWAEWNRARASAPTPGGETMAAATARALGHVHRLAGTASGPVLGVSHCDIIRGVIAAVLGLGLDHVLRFDIDPCSVSWLSVGQGGARVISVNGRD